ncbi:MAG: hypothetical protein ACFCUM_01345 [Bacteroidales bacterium]
MKFIISTITTEKSGRLLWFMTLVINFLWVLIVFASLDSNQVWTYFNSDTMYLPSIYKDIFIDGSGARGWHLNGAPNFFPDMLFFFIFNGILGDFRLAMLCYSVCQYMALLLLLNYLMKLVVSGISWYMLSLANILMLTILFVTVFTGDFVFTFYILSISYHLGAFIMTLLCMVLTLGYFKGKQRYLYFLMISVFLATLSNRLFLVMFVIPSLSVLFFIVLIDHKEKILKFFTAVVFSALTGIIVFALIRSSGYIYIVGTQGKIFNFPNMINSWQVMSGQHFRYLQLMDFRGLTVLLSLVSFALMCILAWIRTRELLFLGKETEKWTGVFYLYFYFFFFIIVLFMPVLNGSYVGWALLRYNIYVFYLSLFNYAFIFHFLLSRKKELRKVFNYALISVVLLISGFTLKYSTNSGIASGITSLIDYYPDYVECIDELAKERNVKYGVGGYWHAKMTTMFSRNNVRVYTVHENMAIWYHVTNRNWYYRQGEGHYGDPEFRFVLASSLDSAAIGSSLGVPEWEHSCNDDFRVVGFKEFRFESVTRQPYFPESAD